MTFKHKIEWWIYAIAAFILLLFVAPAMISADDTLLVIMGVLLLVFFGVWSWQLWISRLINLILKEFS